MGVGLVALEREVLNAIVEQRLGLAQDTQLRKWPRRAGELELGPLDVVAVQVHVHAEPDELAGLLAGLLGEQRGQQPQVGDVPPQAEEGVRGALHAGAVQALGGVLDEELVLLVARRQRNVLELAHIPAIEEGAPAAGVVAQQVYDQAGLDSLADRAGCDHPPRQMRSGWTWCDKAQAAAW